LGEGLGRGLRLVDDSNSECTNSQLNAEHWFARIEKLYNRNNYLIIINNYSNLQMPIMHKNTANSFKKQN